MWNMWSSERQRLDIVRGTRGGGQHLQNRCLLHVSLRNARGVCGYRRAFEFVGKLAFTLSVAQSRPFDLKVEPCILSHARMGWPESPAFLAWVCRLTLACKIIRFRAPVHQPGQGVPFNRNGLYSCTLSNGFQLEMILGMVSSTLTDI